MLPDFPARPPSPPPGPLLAGYSPISGSGREGRGLPAPRSPRAQSSASRMAAAPGVGRGQQVLGGVPRSRGCWVCFAHLAARRSHQAPPRPLPPPRARLRPRKAPPPQRAGSQRGVDLAHDSDSRTASADLHSGFPATVQNRSRGPVRPPWEPRLHPALGPDAFLAASLPSGLKSAAPLCRIRRASSPYCPAHPPVPDPREARAAGVYKAFY